MKSKKKIVAIIIALIIVIIGAVGTYMYFFTDLFKTPEDLFYKYIDKAAKIENEYDYQDFLEQLKTEQTKSYTEKTNVGIELKTKENDYSSIEDQAVYNAINGIGLNIETKSKPSEKKSSSNIKLTYTGIDIAELELVSDNDIYGVKSDFLNNKYIAVENNNLKDLVKKFGGPTDLIPDKIEFLDIYELLYISKEDQDKISKTYKDIIKDNLSSDNFKKTENVTQAVNGVDTDTTVYSLSINEKDYLNIMIKLLETLKEDELSLNLIVEKLNAYINANPLMQSYINYDVSNKSKMNLTKDSLVDILNESIEDYKEQIEYADEESTVEINVYTANGETVRIEFKDGDQEVVLALDFYTENDKKHIVLYSQTTVYSEYSSYRDFTIPKKQLSKIMEIEYNMTKNEDENKLEGSMLFFYNDEEDFKISVDITTKGKLGEGKNESSCNITMENEEISIGLKVNSETEYTDDIEIEELNNRNSNILNDMSMTEIEELFNGIGENFEKTLQDKFMNFGLMSVPSSTYDDSSLLFNSI